MTSRQQLDSFLRKYHPAVAACARRALGQLRQRLPGAIEMVYDNYNGLVIGFGPSDKPSLAIFSIALFPRWVILFFLQGAKIPDPERRLTGSGRIVRHVKLEHDTFDDPAIARLITEALRRAKVPLHRGQRRRLVIKSISAKQRPRRLPTTSR